MIFYLWTVNDKIVGYLVYLGIEDWFVIMVWKIVMHNSSPHTCSEYK